MNHSILILNEIILLTKTYNDNMQRAKALVYVKVLSNILKKTKIHNQIRVYNILCTRSNYTLKYL